MRTVDTAQFLRLGAVSALGAAGAGLVGAGAASAALPAATPQGDDRDEAVQPSDFSAEFPRGSFATQARALAMCERMEGLLVSTYLFGASYAADSSTRLLLGRLLAYDAGLLAWLRTLSGAPAAPGLPVPLDLETAGAQLDRYLTTPSFQ